MAAFTKKIEAGQGKGFRDVVMIQGTGRICSVPELREWTNPTGKVIHFLHVKVASNEVKKNDDGSANQFTEFTDVVIVGARAKGLAGVLGKKQPVWFQGRLRTKSFDSKQYFDSEGKPAQIHRTECNIGQSGDIVVMHYPENAEKAPQAEAQKPKAEPLAANGIPGNAELAAQIKAILATLTANQPASASAQEATTPAAEDVVELGNEFLVEDDVPF